MWAKSFTTTSDSSRQYEDPNMILDRYSPMSILIITVAGIILAETIAMVVVYFVRHLPYYQQVIVDAAIMTSIVFPIVYILSFRPILRHVHQREQVEQVLKSRLRIIQYANTHSLNEILQFTLDELEALTDSKVGYFHFVESDQTTIHIQTWSTNTIQNMCQVNGVERHYSVDQAGVWADCIRERRAIVHNDYASLPNRKGLPEGHAPIVREMAVPVIRDGKIVAVLGVGNKPRNYTAGDVDIVSTLADFAWDIINQKQTAFEQQESERKFRTLADWTFDWELWLDPDGGIVYSSPSCQRITGYTPAEFSAEPDLLIRIIHPNDRSFYEEHHKLIHDETAGVERVEYRIIARDGGEHWVEHICRPVFGNGDRYLGRRISNRDITQRKQTEIELEEQNQKEKILTQTIHTMQLDIARDLHDTIGQNIGYLRMKLAYLSGKIGLKKTEVLAELQAMTQAADESYELVRGTLAVLQYGDSSDLFRIFSRYAEQIEERSSIQVDFSSHGNPKPLSPKRMRQLFYIFRESLANIEKHAEAGQISIKINWDELCLSLTVEDDGKGFDPMGIQFGSHYGLKFMRERADILNGSLNVHSGPGSGTKLVVQVPYE